MEELDRRPEIEDSLPLDTVADVAGSLAVAVETALVVEDADRTKIVETINGQLEDIGIEAFVRSQDDQDTRRGVRTGRTRAEVVLDTSLRPEVRRMLMRQRRLKSRVTG